MTHHASDRRHRSSSVLYQFPSGAQCIQSLTHHKIINSPRLSGTLPGKEATNNCCAARRSHGVIVQNAPLENGGLLLEEGGGLLLEEGGGLLLEEGGGLLLEKGGGFLLEEGRGLVLEEGGGLLLEEGGGLLLEEGGCLLLEEGGGFVSVWEVSVIENGASVMSGKNSGR